jgi:membrane-associated phospholipid phosphatase
MDLIMQYEILITEFFQNLGAWLAPVAQAITFLGTENFYILLLPALYWCIDAGVGFQIGVMLVATNCVNCYLKILFHSPRPFWVDTRVKAYASEASFGLPSGHAQNAAALWGLLAAKFKKNWLTIVSLLVIFLIGLSRIFLGVHFTRDVLLGWVIGGILVGLFILLEKPVRKWFAAMEIWLQILIFLLIAVLIIVFGHLSVLANSGWQLPSEWVEQAQISGNIAINPFNLEGCYTISGVWFGFVTGHVLRLKKKGKIEVSGSIGSRFAMYFIGIAGLMVIYLGLKLIFPEGPLWLGLSLRFLRYGLIGFWVSFGAPRLFESLKLD